jgi:hypothetical protein
MKAEPLDLCGDNRLPELLAERERQAAVIRRAKRIKDEVEAEIREKIGSAREAFTNSWTIEIKTVNRREFVVPACSYERLVARRLEPVEEEAEEEGRPMDASTRRARGRPRQRA